jgi:hypothetical protein
VEATGEIQMFVKRLSNGGVQPNQKNFRIDFRVGQSIV